MVDVEITPNFYKKMNKLKNNSLQVKIKKQIEKIINTPEIGKPMKYSRKGTREVYIAPFRLSYAFLENENLILLLDLYHKDEQ